MGDSRFTERNRPTWRELVADKSGSTRAALLVHGWMASSRVWEPIAELLRGWRLVAPDLWELDGAMQHVHGPALAERLALPRLVDDVLAVADAAGLERFDLVGHSMGGQIAQLVAARAPTRVRTLALLCPVPVRGLPLPAEADALFHAAGGDAEKLGMVLDLACKTLSASARDTLVRDALRIAPALIAAGVDVFTRGAAASLDVILAPTLVLATDDPFLPAALLTEAVAQHIRGARLELLPGPGHYPQVEAPADTARVLASFWSEHA